MLNFLPEKYLIKNLFTYSSVICNFPHQSYQMAASQSDTCGVEFFVQSLLNCAVSTLVSTCCRVGKVLLSVAAVERSFAIELVNLMNFPPTLSSGCVVAIHYMESCRNNQTAECLADISGVWS